MRRGLPFAAGALTCASIMSSAASAATMIQYSNDYTAAAEGGFFWFDPSLGTLNSVTLAVTTTEFRHLYTTGEATYPFDVTWSVNGDVRMGFTGGVEPITGSGSATFSGPGFLEFSLTASATFNLSSAGFIGVHAYPDNPYIPDFYITPIYSGIYDASDLTLTTPYEPLGSVRQWDGCAVGGDGPREWCDQTNLLLTYDYTPFRTLPEPSTWAMMLLGFGAIGLAMRRRTSRLTQLV